jgi:hypothetical protein
LELWRSESFFIVNLEAPQGLTDEVGFVLPRGVASPETSLTPAKSIDLRSAVGRTLVGTIQRRIEDEGFTGVSLDDSAVNIVEGRFPPPHAFIVAVHVEPPRAQMSDETNVVSALLIADAQGNITATLAEVAERMEVYTLRHIIDIDGDDIDEVHFSSGYYEGGYEHLLRWTDEGPTPIAVAGDGA